MPSRRWPATVLVLIASLPALAARGQELVFADGFENGSTCRWAGSVPAAVCGNPAVVFVSRQIPPTGSIYWSVPNDMPGVGGVYSHFWVAAPGTLLVRQADGSLRTLIDGSDPRPESFELIDVNAPDVSWDGGEIVFADVETRSVRAEIDDVSGTFYGIELASLAEIEVLAKGVE